MPWRVGGRWSTGSASHLAGGGGDEQHVLLRGQLRGVVCVRAHHPRVVVPPCRLPRQPLRHILRRPKL
jgi:hypothetical protein